MGAPDQTDSEIAAEAADLVRRLDETPTRWNRNACVRFAMRSEQHQGALVEAEFLLHGVRALRTFDSDELTADVRGDSNVVYLERRNAAAAEARPHQSFTRRTLGLILSSACVAAVTVLLTQSSGLHRTDTRARNRVYCTGVGERQILDLQDRSRIELTTRSCVEVLLPEAKREIHLLQGEALFTVHHDNAKPFTVLTRNVAVEDLGTQFRIYQHEDETDVEVLQGEVRVRALSRADAVHQTPQRLGPGEGATIVGAPDVATIKAKKLPSGALERALAWRDGLLEFRGDSLGHAVSEFNRYNVRQLVIVDPAIEHRSVGGTLRYSDFDVFVELLESAFGIRSTTDESNPNLLNLSGSPQSALREQHKRHKPVQRTAPGVMP
jgi:transmembrane sensor